ncbi:MAG: peptide-methionine (R)-S-oxide reductase MsrB [Flavobacteriaceae bacterium]
MKQLVFILASILFISCNTNAQQQKKKSGFPVTKTDTEWKIELNENEYNVLRKAGTERAFSSKLNKNYKKGVYACAACGTPLFKSDYKYDSGSGWPSFDREIKGNVAFSTDRKLGYTRTEEHCATCGGHLGHVFDDGPKTTGERHCVNGVALKFIPSKTK